MMFSSEWAESGSLAETRTLITVTGAGAAPRAKPVSSANPIAASGMAVLSAGAAPKLTKPTEVGAPTTTITGGWPVTAPLIDTSSSRYQ